MSSLAPYRKAIVSALIAGLTALVAALDDEAIIAAEWATIVLAAVTGGGITYAVPNSRRPGPRAVGDQPGPLA